MAGRHRLGPANLKFASGSCPHGEQGAHSHSSLRREFSCDVAVIRCGDWIKILTSNCFTCSWPFVSPLSSVFTHLLLSDPPRFLPFPTFDLSSKHPIVSFVPFHSPLKMPSSKFYTVLKFSLLHTHASHNKSYPALGNNPFQFAQLSRERGFFGWLVLEVFTPGLILLLWKARNRWFSGYWESSPSCCPGLPWVFL